MLDLRIPEAARTRRRTKHGYAFESEIRLGLERLKETVGGKLWYMKLVDTHSFDKVSEKIIVPKVPSDFLVLVPKEGCEPSVVFLECKSSKVRTSFSLDNISEHQLRSGLELERLGASYYFLINRRDGRKSVVLAVRPSVILEISEALKSAERKSIPWDGLALFSDAIMRKTERYEDKPVYPLGWITDRSACRKPDCSVYDFLLGLTDGRNLIPEAFQEKKFSHRRPSTAESECSG